MTGWLDPDRVAAVLLIVGSLTWLARGIRRTLRPPAATYWLDGQQITRAEHQHLTGRRR